jgi:hypothetical protein
MLRLNQIICHRTIPAFYLDIEHFSSRLGAIKIEIMVYVKLFNFNLNIKLLIAGNYSFLHLYF